MSDTGRQSEFEYTGATPLHNHDELVPGILKALGPPAGRKILDLGCGNGALTHVLAEAGYDVVGADMSKSGIAAAKGAYPGIEFFDQDISEELRPELRGRFDVVLAAEVIEHLFLPRQLFPRCDEALSGRGQIVLSTPFHGYLKNLALSLTNRWDQHISPMWDYGHIKFWSVKTLSAVAREGGYEPREWVYVGRVRPLAKSMIMVADRTTSPS